MVQIRYFIGIKLKKLFSPIKNFIKGGNKYKVDGNHEFHWNMDPDMKSHRIWEWCRAKSDYEHFISL